MSILKPFLLRIVDEFREHKADYVENKARGRIANITSSSMISVSDTSETTILNASASIKSGKTYLLVYKCVSVGSATVDGTYVRLRALEDTVYMTNSRQDIRVSSEYWGDSVTLILPFVASSTKTATYSVRAQVQDTGRSVFFRAGVGNEHQLSVIEVA